MLYWDLFFEGGPMQQSRITAGMLVCVMMLAACAAQQDGTLQGTVSPPAPGVRIALSREGRQIAVAAAEGRDGSFRLALPAGTYDVAVTAPSSPFPVRLSGIVIRPRESTVLTPIVLAPANGSASIRGRVLAANGAARVTLLAEGVERASVTTSAAGGYAFEELPAGAYVLRVQAPGYASDTVTVAVADGRRTTVDIRMVYRTDIDGADWEKGALRARGVGSPPMQAPTPSIRREMAKRAAIADAERNLLKAVRMVQFGPSDMLAASFDERTFTERLRGYVQGYRIVAERDLDGGRMEIEIELPLTGPGGLSSFLQRR
jgi:hypothetical protein